MCSFLLHRFQAAGALPVAPIMQRWPEIRFLDLGSGSCWSWASKHAAVNCEVVARALSSQDTFTIQTVNAYHAFFGTHTYRHVDLPDDSKQSKGDAP